MGRITVDEDDWLRMKKDMKFVKDSLKIAEINQYNISQQLELTEQERRILNYIQANPGSNKQALVDGLKDIHSRNPIFKSIRNLVNCGMIIQRKDKTNRQTYNLFINSDSLVVTLVKDLDNYKRSFSKLLSYVTDIPDSVPLDLKKSLQMFFAAMLLRIHTCFVTSYFLTALFRWPVLTADEETLNKLYAIFFSNIQQLQLTFVKAVPGWFGGKTDFKTISHSAVTHLGIQKLIEDMSQIAHGISHKAQNDPKYHFLLEQGGVGKELESVMDIIWKNSQEFLRFVDPRGKGFKEKIKDWREIDKYRKPEIRNKNADVKELWIRKRIREVSG